MKDTTIEDFKNQISETFVYICNKYLLGKKALCNIVILKSGIVSFSYKFNAKKNFILYSTNTTFNLIKALTKNNTNVTIKDSKIFFNYFINKQYLIKIQEQISNFLKNKNFRYFKDLIYEQRDKNCVLGTDINKMGLDNLAKIKNFLHESFIESNKNKINWKFVSKYQKLSETFIEKHQDKVNWDCIALYQDVSKNFIKKHKDKINWHKIYLCKNLPKSLF